MTLSKNKEEIMKTPFLLFQSSPHDYYNMSQDSVRGVQQETLLSKVFFHPRNVELIQKRIIKEVFNRTNGEYLIEKQDETDLQIVMRSIFLQKANFCQDDIKEQVRILNNLVVDEVVPGIVSEIKMYMGYLDRAFSQPIPIERPKNVSNAGTKTLPSVSKTFESF